MGSSTCSAASQNGHFEMLKWAHENGCPWDADTMVGAVKGGHLNILKWLQLNGCPKHDWLLVHAAYGGHLEIVKYALDNELGTSLTHLICSIAAGAGHLEILQWAHAHGYSWNSTPALGC
ncbi:ankyrin containing protein (ISS) [Seminavis robusta]|uniref:Ankyrin containing protein (ISS) n=1 Tax=Seminavis robusta TaxID=568900 RepID=A0A9N8H230_9STRA|nr:ankyrin containing protein (ISS) [Seminavis robusta]|eukprot:Sro55_g032490.1 ankyrin containing protein (ISS) (120) ;mRNA; r:127693-128052